MGEEGRQQKFQDLEHGKDSDEHLDGWDQVEGDVLKLHVIICKYFIVRTLGQRTSQSYHESMLEMDTEILINQSIEADTFPQLQRWQLDLHGFRVVVDFVLFLQLEAMAIDFFVDVAGGLDDAHYQVDGCGDGSLLADAGGQATLPKGCVSGLGGAFDKGRFAV